MKPVRLDRLSSWPRAGFLSLAVIAACSGGRGAGDQPRGPDSVVASGPTVAASSTATVVEPPGPTVEVAPPAKGINGLPETFEYVRLP